MNPNPEVIDISSDSSSDESWNSTPFPPYVPPYRPPMNGTRTKEQARNMKHDINALILASLATIKPLKSKTRLEKEFQEEASDWAAKLPIALTQALEKVVSSLKKIPVPEDAQPSQKRSGPIKVVLGLACPRLWDKEMQSRGMHRSMPDPKAKGLQRRFPDPKDKGKRPME